VIVMKSYSATRRRGATVITIASAIFASLFALAMAGSSLAQDVSTGVPSWDELDSVLVLPPVYRPDGAGSAKSEPNDACAEGCSSSSDPDVGEPPSAVAGTADNPTNVSAGTADDPADNPPADNSTDEGAAAEGSTPQEASLPQQAAAADGQQGADAPDSPLGSAEEYEKEAAAEEMGTSGVVQGPSVIIGAPIFLPGTLAPAEPAITPGRSQLTSPAWMPQPMARVVPLPSIVPRGFPRTMGVFSGGAFSGRFRGGFPHMSGFHGGFGRR
jgi:hypothetical protein